MSNEQPLGRLTRRRALQFTAATLFAGSIAGCTGYLADESSATWPMRNYDAANTGYNPDGTAPGGDVTELWSITLGGSATWWNTPGVAAGLVFVPVEETETLYAFDADDGETVWSVDVGGGLEYTTVAVDDGTVFSGGRIDTLTALEGETGDEHWIADVDPPSDTSLVLSDALTVSGDSVFACTANPPHVFAIDVETGEERWHEVVAEHGIGYKPAVVDDTVYISTDAAVVALDAADGTEVWRFEGDGGGAVATTAPVVGDGVVYFVSHGFSDGTGVVAIDTDDGEEVWRANYDGTLETPLARADETIVAARLDLFDPGDSYGDADTILVGLDESDGDERWRTDIEGAARGGISIVDETIHVATERSVTALRLADGEEVWQLSDFDGEVSGTTPVIADDNVHVVIGDTLYALE